MLEILQAELNEKVEICYPLNKSVTGVLLFSQSTETAKTIANLFAQNKIKSTYWLVTDKPSDEDELLIFDVKFKRIKRTPFFELWQATTHSHDCEKVRSASQQAGLNILGDTENGGTNFPHLCLHLQEVHIADHPAFSSPPPRFFERMGLLKDIKLIQFLSEIDRRQRLYNFLEHPTECLRLVDTENERCDMLGRQLWIYWYHETEPTPKDLTRWNFIAQLMSKEWHLHWMKNRGQNPNEIYYWQSENWKNNWQASENNIHFHFSSEKGQSPGLFLDQAENRQQAKNICQQHKNTEVLNLFAYTCGFSVATASCSSTVVTTVDTSAPFLEWGKQNFNLNGIDPSQHQFFCQDVMLFLKGTLKRKRQFDLIICDPPSFGRSKEHVFKLDKDYEELLTICWKILKPGGQMLFSTNFEKWNETQWQIRIKKILTKAQITPSWPRWDYELPNTERKLKSFWLQKK